MKELRDQLAASLAAVPRRLRYIVVALAVLILLLPLLLLVGSLSHAWFATAVLMD